MSDLIDTTEMYLRTIFELEEEGIVPLRARIAERLQQSGPTVSQTVARMERDGLVVVSGDRHLELTAEGRAKATRVMRKHRLAERLLVDVIGLEWEYVHEEACRWEHVMSERVEKRILAMLDHPTESPYGNPIPGLDELREVVETGDGVTVGTDADPVGYLAGLQTLPAAAAGGGRVEVVVRRLGEPVQGDPALMARLAAAGLRPGGTVAVEQVDSGVRIGTDPATSVDLPRSVADHVFVAA
ncbi:metal-dependent transcriptional regulator [Thalassiella azotivora]